MIYMIYIFAACSVQLQCGLKLSYAYMQASYFVPVLILFELLLFLCKNFSFVPYYPLSPTTTLSCLGGYFHVGHMSVRDPKPQSSSTIKPFRHRVQKLHSQWAAATVSLQGTFRDHLVIFHWRYFPNTRFSPIEMYTQLAYFVTSAVQFSCLLILIILAYPLSILH